MVKAMDTHILCRILCNLFIHASIQPNAMAILVLINAIHAIGHIRFLAAIRAIIHALANIRAATNATSAIIMLSPGQDHTPFNFHIPIKGFESCNSRDGRLP
jgi:hypothetical protein